MLFIEMLNGTSLALNLGFLFGISRAGNELHNIPALLTAKSVEDKVRFIRTYCMISIHTMIFQTITPYMRFLQKLCEHMNPRQLVILNITNSYWTVWHYDLIKNPLECIGISAGINCPDLLGVNRETHLKACQAMCQTFGFMDCSVCLDLFSPMIYTDFTGHQRF